MSEEWKRLSKTQHKRHDHNGEKRSIVKLEEEKHKNNKNCNFSN